MKRYEQSIRVVTAFFSVLLGFGLKKLLDAAEGGQAGFTPPEAAWPCFLLSVLLFLRFLLGANNHMWVEYVQRDLSTEVALEVSPRAIIFDFAYVIGFGIVGMKICYAKTLNHFLWWNLGLTVSAGLWVLVGMRVRRVPKNGSGQNWDFWWWINALQSLGIGLVMFAKPEERPWVLSWLLAPWYAVLLVMDVSRQLKRLLWVAPKKPVGS